MGATDWHEWHRSYDDPASSLSQRLVVVGRRIGDALDLLGAGCERILSLCAGDGRDVLPELASRPACRPASVRLVELDPVLADGARRRAEELGLPGVDVVVGDAGDRRTFDDVLPVDLLLLCGVFGNVVDADIRTTLQAAAAMVRPGGCLVWTRGRFEHGDLRPEVRRWSVDAGFIELAFDGEPAPYGVGLYRNDRPGSRSLPDRLFTFVR